MAVSCPTPPAWAPGRRARHAAGLLAVLAACLAAPPAGAQLLAPCSGAWLKPLLLLDRWDDQTAVPGHPDWAGNGAWDAEPFDDRNASGEYDPGEPFDDGNGNGIRDAERYHPLLTGYVPDPVPGNTLSPDGDAGRVLVVKSGEGGPLRARTAYAVALPAVGHGAPAMGAAAFREAMLGPAAHGVRAGESLRVLSGRMAGVTDQVVAELVAQDPHARYDPATGGIVGSFTPISPRIVLVAFGDPRVGPSPGAPEARVVKIGAFFLEPGSGGGTIEARFLRVTVPTAPCDCCGGEAKGNFVFVEG